jgi:O-antigen ligase
MRTHFDPRGLGHLPSVSRFGSRFEANNPAAAHQQGSDSHQAKRKKVSWPVLLFVLGLAWPCVIFVGPLRMSLYRIVLIAMLLPCLIMFVSGKAGRMRLADIAVLLFAFWCVLSLTVVSGTESSAQTSGIVFLETAAPYLLGRCFIRDADDFHSMVRLLFTLVLVLLPFAFVEFVSGHNVSRELFAMICPTVSGGGETRVGFTRVQSVFEHAILFGVCTGSVFALAHLVLGYKKSFPQRILMSGTVAVTVFLSLSAGPLIALIIQGILLAWNALLQGVKARWKILICLVVVLSLATQLAANRSLPAIVSSLFAFDEASYWYRVLIWDYGSQAVLKYPLFGAGMNEWERPNWMIPTIDNFWLYLAVRYGLPASLLLFTALLSIILGLSVKKDLDDKLTAYRTAFLISMTAFFLVGWTVHFWDAAYVLFLFLMGSGLWMLDANGKRTTLPLAQQPARSRTT